MSETPRDQRDLWHEVSRTFEELGEALRVHLSPDAARSPSDPTHPSEGRAGKPADPTETEPAPWADPAGAGQADDFGDPWSAATDRPGRTTAADATSASDPTTTGPADSGRTTSGPAETGTTAAGGSPTETTAGASGTDAPGPAGTARGATETGPTSPGMSAECARWVAEESPLQGIGVETIGTDAGAAHSFDPPFPCHSFLLGNGKYGLAQLQNLDRLPPTGTVIVAAPLRIVGGSGSPVRVLALVER